MNVEEQVRELVVKGLNVEPSQVTPQATIKEDLGADSLDATELIIAIESAFSISIPDDEALQLLTFGDVLRCIEQKMKAKSTRVTTGA